MERYVFDDLLLLISRGVKADIGGSYSPDDNRFDHRPFLYPRMWDNWSFKMIDQDVERMEAAQQEEAESGVAHSKGDK